MSESEAPSPQPEDLRSSTRIELPPVRIHHLMAWTALTSVMASLLFAPLREGDARYAGWAGFRLVWVLMAAATLTALGVVWRHRSAGGKQWQPGHALLVLHALELSFWMLFEVLAFQVRSESYVAYQLHSFLNGLMILAAALSLRRTLHQPCWRWLFVALAFEPILSPLLRTVLEAGFVLGYGYYASAAIHYSSYLTIGLGIMALAWRAIREDQRRGLRRHWTHWVGIAPLAIGWVITAIVMTVILLSPEPQSLRN